MSPIVYKMDVAHIILFLVSVSCVNFSSQDDVIPDIRRSNAMMTNRQRHMRVRCTRRYTPGTCLQPIGPVWTFVAPLQSCQERLGCPAREHSNRFNTFEECVSVCRELIYLFMFLQSSFENETFKVPTEGFDHGIHGARPAEMNAIYNDLYNERERGDSSDTDSDDDDVPNIDNDYRRDLNKAISAVHWDPLAAQEWEPDYSDQAEQATSEANDERPPLPSREELTPDDDLREPDIDKFPEISWEQVF